MEIKLQVKPKPLGFLSYLQPAQLQILIFKFATNCSRIQLYTEILLEFGDEVPYF